jgi:hypothetical protein
MPEKTEIRKEKKVMLTDKELIEKYEAGAQPVPDILAALLYKTSPTAPTKIAKRP